MRRAWATRSLLAGVDGLDELEVGHHAAYRHGPTDDGRDAVLEHEPLALGDVAHEGLVLREAEDEEAVAHLDRAAGGRRAADWPGCARWPPRSAARRRG